jgi:secreted PhoX family phosphatase
LIYLATPYSADKTAGFGYAQEAAVWLHHEGFFVFSPILHWHETAIKFGLRADAEFWKDYNRHMLGLSDKVLVYQAPGWRESKGIAMEMRWGHALGKTVDYMSRISSHG